MFGNLLVGLYASSDNQLNDKVSTLDLGSNDVGVSGLASLSEAIADNETITALYLSSNRINGTLVIFDLFMPCDFQVKQHRL